MRAGILFNLLKRQGLNVHIVDVFRPEDNFPAHVFVEVFNPETNAWEVQDPDYNISWKVMADGRTASIRDLVSLPSDDFFPCYADGICAFNRTDIKLAIKEKVRDYFGVAVIRDPETKERHTIFNPEKFDLKWKFRTHNGLKDFCEFAPKNCRGEIEKVD